MQATRGTSVLPNPESYAQRENKLHRQQCEKPATHVASEVHLPSIHAPTATGPQGSAETRVPRGHTCMPTCSSHITVSYCFLGMLHSPSGTSQTAHGKDAGQHLVKKSSPMRHVTCPSLLIPEWLTEEWHTAQDTLSGYISKFLPISK